MPGLPPSGRPFYAESCQQVNDQQKKDKAVGLRAAGKAAVVRRTVWSVEFRGLKLRCLEDGRQFVVQAHQGSGWAPIATGGDALELLRQVVTSQTFEKFNVERG